MKLDELVEDIMTMDINSEDISSSSKSVIIP